MRFENQIAASKKFSIGNCYEYALIALEYMVKNNPDVNSEVFYIQGGDHVFLVIGRKEGSNSRDPKTWGNEAFICDPWSNSVYPAKEYLNKTKNFFYTQDYNGNYENYIQDFDPKKHSLQPKLEENSTRVLQGSCNLKKKILNFFIEINNKHCAIFDKLANDLDSIKQDLIKKYGKSHPKVKIMEQKITEIRKEIEKIRNEIETYALQKNQTKPEKYQSHQEMQFEIQRKMKEHLRNIESGVLEASNSLKKHGEDGSFIAMVMEFLTIKPREYKKFNKSIIEANNALLAAPKTPKF